MCVVSISRISDGFTWTSRTIYNPSREVARRPENLPTAHLHDRFICSEHLTCHGTVAVGSLWPGVPPGSCWPQPGEGELTLWLNMSVSCRSCVYWHRCCRIISTLSTSSRSSSCTGGKDQRPLSMSPQLGDLLTRQVSDHPIRTTPVATCLDPIPSEPLGNDKELTLYLEVQVKIMRT